MPTYAFRCPDCATTFEERRGFAHADDPATCPSCGGIGATKQMGTPMVFRKGVAARALLESPGAPPLPRASTDRGSGCPCCSGRRPAIAAPAEAMSEPS
ncbi:MAG TPA: zinc ribbon domain-containing protein [Thermomicrobiales bacterium]|jgi:putative FmdB family regulatory protein|nr:zinc ribbon domain-containing protein [Thermomicrobiales bacterium]